MRLPQFVLSGDARHPWHAPLGLATQRVSASWLRLLGCSLLCALSLACSSTPPGPSPDADIGLGSELDESELALDSSELTPDVVQAADTELTVDSQELDLELSPDGEDLEPDGELDAEADDFDADEVLEELDLQPVVDNDAALVDSNFPSTLTCGEAATATVTLRNTGRLTWTREAEFKLGAVGDEDPLHPGDTRIWLEHGTSVPTASSYSFTIELVAPSSPGVYRSDWQMVREGVAWFGELVVHEVHVDCELPVDASSILGKALMGYQGWFLTPDDGSPAGDWRHWFRDNTADAAHLTVDFWPDLSELDADERYDTAMTLPDGSRAQVFSSWNAKTVARHFAWMQEHGIDGVMLQRFLSELGDPRFLSIRNKLAENVRLGAEASGRVFCLTYDLSGANAATLVADIQADWQALVATGLTTSERYLHHDGKPVLGLWGLGFTDRAGTPAQAAELIAWFQADAPAHLQATLMGGVPTHWRSLNGDSQTDPAWASVYRSYDIISPWSVGRYGNDAEADQFRTQVIEPDLIAAHAAGALYMPTVFPGFSWYNLHGGPLNQLPRRGGRFYWRQVFNAVDAGADSIFVAMFDEVDEGTAMFKLAPSSATLPVNAALVPLDADGESLPSDHYLRLGGATGKLLRGEIPLSPMLP